MMSPSIAGAGQLSTDPRPGTPEWEKERRLHDELAARLAKLHRMRAQLPVEIMDTEDRLRMSGLRLGLNVDNLPEIRSTGRGKPAWEAALELLPGRQGEIARKLGISSHVAGQRLAFLRSRGLASKDPGYGGVWRRVEPEAGES